MFGSLLKAATAVVTIPVAAVADAITMGGALTDQNKPYTAQACEDLVQNLKDASKPESRR